MLFWDIILSEIFFVASESKAVGSEMRYVPSITHPEEEINVCSHKLTKGG